MRASVLRKLDKGSYEQGPRVDATAASELISQEAEKKNLEHVCYSLRNAV